MRYHLLAGALLSIILFLLLFSATEDGPEPALDPALALSQDYDYYMNGVDSTRFRLDGANDWRLRAARLTHYPEQGGEAEFSLVEAPDIELYPSDQPRWRITAEQGRVAETAGAGQRIDLNGDVVARQLGGERDLAVYTEALSLYPDSERASSDEEVLLLVAGGEMRGLGMRADLARRRVELLNQVRGRYDPPQ